MQRAEGPNWSQRYLIHHELAGRAPKTTSEGLDPLGPVKNYYWQIYADAVGQPDLTPDSSPVHTAAADQISLIINEIANQTLATNEKMIQIVMSRNPHSYVQNKSIEMRDAMMSAVCRGQEEILEILIRWMAKGDSWRASNLGKIISHLLPSEEQRRIEEIASKTREELDEIPKRFLNTS